MGTINEDYKADISNKIIEALKKGTAPLQKPWIDNIPFNAVTGREYRGINSIVLSVEQDRLSENGDSRWATKQQAESKGWAIKDGAEPKKIFVLILPKKKVIHSKILGDRVVNDRKSAIRKTFEVYHALQIRGIPAFVKRFRKQIIDNQVIEEIILNASARIFFGGSEAYYSPREDLIRMPNKENFVGTEAYYSTLLHELAVRPDRALLKVA